MLLSPGEQAEEEGAGPAGTLATRSSEAWNQRAGWDFRKNFPDLFQFYSPWEHGVLKLGVSPQFRQEAED